LLSRLENQTYTGVIGEVYREEANIGAGQFFITNERRQLFDMVYYDVDGYCFFVKRPDSASDWGAIIRPYQLEVWIAILASGMCVLLFVFCWLYVIPEPGLQPLPAVFYSFGVIIGQTFPVMPRQDYNF
jgi:hypothetical protein